MSNYNSRTSERLTPKKTFFQSQMGKAMLERSQQRATRRGRTARRLAEKAGMINLPKPQEFVLPIDFDPAEGIFLLGEDIVYVDRASTGDGYQRDYDDARARQYGLHFDWGLYGRPLLNRRDDGSLWLVAGQHRLGGAAYAGHEDVPVLIYDGLSKVQEAYLFNQEATQKVNLTPLDDFHSGVQSGFPDYVAVNNIVESLGGHFALKSSPRLGGDTVGVTASKVLLKIHDYVGEEVLYEALSIVRDAYGKITGKGIDGALYSAMAMFVGIYSEDSPHGTMDRKKMIEQLQRTTPMALKARAMNFSGNQVTARFQALHERYNWKATSKKLDLVSPDWRKAVAKELCVSPGCHTGSRGRAGRAYRRNLCRYHYELSKGGEEVMLGGR